MSTAPQPRLSNEHFLNLMITEVRSAFRTSINSVKHFQCYLHFVDLGPDLKNQQMSSLGMIKLALLVPLLFRRRFLISYFKQPQETGAFLFLALFGLFPISSGLDGH